MKQIFEILQEERDRILNLHEDATKRQYLTEGTYYGWKLIKSAGSGNVDSKGSFKSFKVTKKVGNSVKGEFVDAKFNYKSGFSVDCSKPEIITLKGSGLEGTKLKVGPNSKKLILKKCGVSQKIDNQDQGTNNSTDNKYVIERDHILYDTNNREAYKLLKDTLMTFNPEKNGAAVRVATLDNKSKLNTWFNCGTAKFSAKNPNPFFDFTTNETIPAGQKTFFYYTDKPFADFLLKKCSRLKKGSESEKLVNTSTNTSTDTSTDTSGLDNSQVSVVNKPNDTALDQILAKIKTPNPVVKPEAKQGPQVWEG